MDVTKEVPKSRTLRRVVTGHDDYGNSVILSDAPPPRIHEMPGARFWEVWSTDRAPALIQSKEPKDPTDRSLTLGSPGGSVIRVVDFEGGGPPSPMHRTSTIDYGIVLEGEIVMLLPGEHEVQLKPGDIVVQRGTDHAWQNKSGHLARMAFILLGGEFGEELRAKLPDMKLTP